MESNNYEGKIHEIFLDITQSKYQIKVKINDNIFLLKLQGMGYRLIDGLRKEDPIRFKGILDKDKKEIKSPEDVWVKLA